MHCMHSLHRFLSLQAAMCARVSVYLLYWMRVICMALSWIFENVELNFRASVSFISPSSSIKFTQSSIPITTPKLCKWGEVTGGLLTDFSIMIESDYMHPTPMVFLAANCFDLQPMCKGGEKEGKDLSIGWWMWNFQRQIPVLNLKWNLQWQDLFASNITYYSFVETKPHDRFFAM